MWPLIGVTVCSLVLSACTRRELPHVLANDAYVWQRSWNDSLVKALTESAVSVQIWRVLAAEADAKANLTTIRVDAQTLQRLGKPVIAVVRIDGRRGTPLGNKLAGEIAAVVTD